MKKSLIVWGGWEGHQPEQCARIVHEALRSEGFEVETVSSTAVLDRSDLGRFDLIVPIVSMSLITESQSGNLYRAVELGTGLAGFHGGMGDSFRMDCNYQFMVGGQFVAHPGGIISYRVNIVKKTDPIVSGIADFDYVSEQYYMHVDPANEVLATTIFSGQHASWTKNVVMPVVWKRNHGAGRVFYSSLGHQAAEFEIPQMRTILLRGMLWAAQKEPLR
jgi:type 1 glutamine amidotransferase